MSTLASTGIEKSNCVVFELQVDASALRDPDSKKLAVDLKDTYLPEKSEDGKKGDMPFGSTGLPLARTRWV